MSATEGQAKAGVPSPDREAGSDLYDTPHDATKALLKRESFPSLIWEPAAGIGMISEVLQARGYETIETDIALPDDPWIPVKQMDFFAVDQALAPAIITNPPFSLLTRWMERCLDLRLQKWALLIPLTALSGAGRCASVYQRHAPQRVHVFSHRIPFRRRGYTGNISPIGMHAWAVWDCHKPTHTTLSWIEEKIA